MPYEVRRRKPDSGLSCYTCRDGCTSCVCDPSFPEFAADGLKIAASRYAL